MIVFIRVWSWYKQKWTPVSQERFCAKVFRNKSLAKAKLPFELRQSILNNLNLEFLYSSVLLLQWAFTIIKLSYFTRNLTHLIVCNQKFFNVMPKDTLLKFYALLAALLLHCGCQNLMLEPQINLKLLYYERREN